MHAAVAWVVNGLDGIEVGDVPVTSDRSGECRTEIYPPNLPGKLDIDGRTCGDVFKVSIGTVRTQEFINQTQGNLFHKAMSCSRQHDARSLCTPVAATHHHFHVPENQTGTAKLKTNRGRFAFSHFGLCQEKKRRAEAAKVITRHIMAVARYRYAKLPDTTGIFRENYLPRVVEGQCFRAF